MNRKMNGEMMEEKDIITSWIDPYAKVLDLGCGDGSILCHLEEQRKTTGYGLEIDDNQIEQSIERGVNVIKQDFDQGLSNFADKSFDVVLLASTLQAAKRPDLLVDEMLRIGRKAIVTFPNFSYWRHRLYFLLGGRMPKSKIIPYEWYDTPNIHHCTIKDFDKLCRDKNVQIINKHIVGRYKFAPNLLAYSVMYLLYK